jgi:hypothetical protein
VYEEYYLLGHDTRRLVEDYRHFEETYSLHIPGQRVIQATTQQAASKATCSLLGLFLNSEAGDIIFFQNVRKLYQTASHPRRQYSSD